MVNRVNAAFDDMKGSENTGGTENSRGLEHMSTVENSGESLMRNLLPPDICVAETTGDFEHCKLGHGAQQPHPNPGNPPQGGQYAGENIADFPALGTSARQLNSAG